MRLTERKTIYPSCDKQGNLSQIDYIEIKDKKLAEEKLCELEDIEDDKLGIDLATLFKAFENGIYYTNYGHGTINYCDKPKLIPCYVYESFDGKVKRKVYNYDFIVSHKGLAISTKTHKKFWALTKEDLE